MSEQHSKSLLLELVIVIAIFTVCSAVLIGVFASGYKLGNTATVRDRALGEAQCLADALYVKSEESLLESYQFTKGEDGAWRLPCDGYTLTVTLSHENSDTGIFHLASVSAETEDGTLFTLPVTHYEPAEVLR